MNLQKTTNFFVFLWCVLAAVILLDSCTHDPIFEEIPVTPVDTSGQPIDSMPIDTMPVDTMPVDTMILLEPCEPDLIYFNQQVLPILLSNCAFSGCHDAASAEDGVILESYESVIETADVEPFNLNDSEIYEVLVDNDLDERMPPEPTGPLSSTQINLIATWILQGAEDLECDPNAAGCETDGISFSGFVFPLIQNNCEGCHSGNTPAGGINLINHSTIAAQANAGSLYAAINHEEGFEPMPQGSDKLDECTIEKIKSWIDEGAPNN